MLNAVLINILQGTGNVNLPDSGSSEKRSNCETILGSQNPRADIAHSRALGR